MRTRSHRACNVSIYECLAVLALFFVSLLPARAAIPEYEFHDIRAVTGHYMIPYGISNDGTIVGSLPSLYGTGFVLRNGVLTTIEIPGSQSTVIRAISPDGTRCVGTWADQGDRWHSFLYELEGTIHAIPDLGTYTEASDISDSGMIVGSCYTFHGDPIVPGPFPVGEAFVMQGDTVQTYSAPGAGYTHFGGVNNAGRIAGYWNGASPGALDNPFLLEGQTLTPLTVPRPLDSIEVTDINNLGQIVGYHTDVSFLLDGENKTELWYTSGGERKGTRITGINDFGVIVGYRYEPGPRGFIAYPKQAIPEASSLALLLAGAPLAAARIRRRSWGTRGVQLRKQRLDRSVGR